MRAIKGLTITGSIVIVFSPERRAGGPDSYVDERKNRLFGKACRGLKMPRKI